jgi:ferrous iron transport protein A
MRLDELPKGGRAVVTAVHRRSADDAIAQRLMELGFVSGEPVRLLATGPLGGEPLLVQVGYTRFALRCAEAARIEVAMEGRDQ